MVDREEEEEIFQINDFTFHTDFEQLTADIELFMRQSGISVDIRLPAQHKPSNKFSFHGFEFTCFHIPKDRESAVLQETAEPMSLVEMEDEEKNLYPFFGRPLTQWFGINEFLVIRGKIPEREEKTVLSAFAVGGESAKCALPVFITRSDESGAESLLCEGLLNFPGYYATYEVWELDKSAFTKPQYDFLRNFHSLLTYYSTQIAPTASNPKATVHTAYKQGKDKKYAYDVVSEVYAMCRWSARPAEELFECMEKEGFIAMKAEAIRVYVLPDITTPSVSEFILQLRAQGTPSYDEEIALREDVPEAVYFDEFVLLLEDVLPITPINSIWTKTAIELMVQNAFSGENIRMQISRIRQMTEFIDVRVDIINSFKQYTKYSVLHQHILMIFAAQQCIKQIRESGETSSSDSGSRVLFLNLNPAHILEQQVIDPPALRMYREGMILRVLKAYLVDKFMELGATPSESEFIQWHKSACVQYGYYHLLCSQLDDGRLLSLWQSVISKSYRDTVSTVLNELSKEMEMSLQQLEGLGQTDLTQYLPGMCVSGIIAETFRRQLIYFNEVKAPALVLPAIKELIRPVFEEFRKNCKHLPNFQCMDSVVLEEVRNELKKLETAIGRAFSLTLKFPESKGLVTQLMTREAVDFPSGSDRTEVLHYIDSISASGPWRTHIVLRTPGTRFCLLKHSKEAKLALARVYRERPID